MVLIPVLLLLFSYVGVFGLFAIGVAWGLTTLTSLGRAR